MIPSEKTGDGSRFLQFLVIDNTAPSDDEAREFAAQALDEIGRAKAAISDGAAGRAAESSMRAVEQLEAASAIVYWAKDLETGQRVTLGGEDGRARLSQKTPAWRAPARAYADGIWAEHPELTASAVAAIVMRRVPEVKTSGVGHQTVRKVIAELSTRPRS